MFEGRVCNYTRLDLKLGVAATVDDSTAVGTANYNVGGELVCWQARGYLGSGEEERNAHGVATSSWVKNIRLYVEETQAGTSWSFTWDERSISESGTGANVLLFQIDDYKLYTRYDGTWRLRVGSSRLYVDGVLYATYGGTTIDSTETIQPRTAPGLSIAPEMFGTAGASNGITVAQAAAAGWSYTSEVSVAGTVTGGWRFVEGGDTVELPVSFPAPPIPSLAGTTAPVATISALTTWDAEISVTAGEISEDQWCNDSPGHVIENPYNTSYYNAGRAWLWPIVNRQTIRMCDPYEMVVRRYGFPMVKDYGERVHTVGTTYLPGPGDTITNATYDSIVLYDYPTDTQVVSTVAADFEGPLYDVLQSPWVTSGTYGEAGVAGIGYAWGGSLPTTCPTPNWRTGRIAKGATAYYAWPDLVQTRNSADELAANGDMLLTFRHPEPMARLFATWWCPHWQFVPVFPPNTIDTNADTIPDEQNVWQVLGNDVAAEYWLYSRQQWMSEMAISNTETARRNLICSEPLSDSLLHRGGASTPQLWQDIYPDTFFGLPTCPWGISRFEAQKPSIPASLACDSASSSLVTALTNCTLAAGSSIVVTPTAAGDVEFVMSWANFATKPWLYGAMAKQFKFNWTTTNISAINIYAEGWDGERVLIYANADKATWKDWPLTGGAVKFAGSWEQDFGRGIITDVGADVDAAGISPATMGDTLRSCVFGLLPGRTARRIVWVITPTSSGSNVTVGYPEFRHNSEVARVVPEIAQQGVFLTPDGPGVRWGSVQYWNSGTNSFCDPPIASDPVIMPTILDGLCTRRVWFEGKAADDGLDTEIATIYDSNEYTLRKHMAVDPTDAGQSCHSFWVAGATSPVVCLVSSLREMPPMQCFPVRQRDTDWQTTDTWGYRVYSLGYQDRYYSSAKQELKLNDGTIYWSDDDALDVNGWKIYSHSRAVDNTESTFNFLGPSAIDYAELRPWHGSFAVIDKAPESGGCLSSDCHLDGRHFRAYLYNGEVVVDVRGVDGTWTTHLTGIMADWVSIRIDKMAKNPLLYLVTQEGTAIKQYTSSTSGATFSVSTTLHSTGTPRYPAQDIELDGVRYTYWVNGASAPYVVQYLIRDRAGNTLASVATAISGVDDSPIAVRKATPPGGVATVYLQAIVGGAVVEYTSTDGKVFV